MLKWLSIVLAGLLLLMVLGAVALWSWAGTQHSLDWALRRAAAALPALQVEQATGSLRTGLRAARLVWQQEGLRAELTGVDIAWEPAALLRRTLRLTHARAESVQVQDRRPPSGEPPRPPAQLTLPLQVAVDELRVGRLQWDGATVVEASDLAARYVHDGARHRLDLNSLKVLGGSYRGRATLEARAPMALDATLEARLDAPVPGSGGQTVPLRLNATAQGPLTELQASALLEAQEAGRSGELPRASATARLTPWGAFPVPQAQVQLREIDAGALWPQAPATRLGGELRIAPAGAGRWALVADLRNGLPGPWDDGRLPLERLRTEAEWRSGGTALVRQLDATLGGGRLQGQGEWRQQGGWRAQAQLRGVNPAALYSELAPLPLGGTLQASSPGSGAAAPVAFEVDLQAQGDPARPASGPVRGALAEALQALELRRLQARGRWEDGLLSLPQLQLRTSDATLEGSDLELRPRAPAGGGRLGLTAPGLRAQAEGRIAETRGQGSAQVVVADAGRALDWVSRLPRVPDAVGEWIAQGRAELQLAWDGGWQDPQLRARLSVPTLQLAKTETAPGAGAGTPPDADTAWRLSGVQLQLDGRLRDAQLQARGQAQSGTRRLELELAGRGGRAGTAAAPVWQGEVGTLAATLRDSALSPGPWTLALQRPLSLRWSGGRLESSAGQALLTAPVRRGPAQAVLAWEPVRWGGGELHTAGRLTGLPLAWAELLGGARAAGAALAGDLVFDAQWEARLGPAVQLRAAVTRSRGDLAVRTETAGGAPARVPAGVREAALTLESNGETVTLALRWDSERAGRAAGQLQTRLSRDPRTGWAWPADAPLSGVLRAQLPRVDVWSLLAPPGWRLRGSLEADLTVEGTRADPRLEGTLAADDLGLRSVVDGLELQGGRLRARLDGRRLLIDEFLLQGAGAPGTGGTLRASGEGAWVEGQPQLRVQAQLDRLRASTRSDRQLTLSGQAAARVDAAGTELTGSLRVDQALIVLPEETAPRLGEDVVVRNAPGLAHLRPARDPDRPDEPPQGVVRPVRLKVAIALGDDFRLRGRGISTRLAGELVLSGESLAQPRLVGVIRTIGGEYNAYGQRLDIERGVLRFTGPLDNPSLDVLAVRPRLVQRVGVQVTGTAQAPFVRLYSEPELSEAEKLSWLVLGRASASGGAEAALLQQAAVALLASRTGSGGGRGIAGRLGLDELSVRRDGEDGAAVRLGRRFAQNFYAAYERSLSGALGTLYVFYDLSRRLTVRAEAGDRTAIDLIYSFSFD
ncbi:Conserved hypothetical protein [Ramlibacter tataouinensis TTB310]|uniref:Translocation and assembly module TamB C-terminal domain-containing protein n=2 Tax=Ramlibacter tataouinensis TaxID=94132 RepID=F5Y2U3_RAMTT|nr:Conserved hypothetical protein [Ramlibacter tataouinensis TTB310]